MWQEEDKWSTSGPNHVHYRKTSPDAGRSRLAGLAAQGYGNPMHGVPQGWRSTPMIPKFAINQFDTHVVVVVIALAFSEEYKAAILGFRTHSEKYSA
jgi:hypothetical protein